MDSTSLIPDTKIVLSTGENPDVIRPNNNGWSIDVMKIPTASVEVKLGYILEKGAILRLPEHDNVYQYEVTTLTSNMTKLNTKTVKNLFKKTEASGRDVYLALLKYRNTPLDMVNLSPVQMLMSRHLKSCLPVSDALLKPQDQKLLQDQLKVLQDQGNRELPFLAPGQQVRIQENQSWKTGVVKSVDDAPRSYNITMSNRRQYRRNHRHLWTAAGNATVQLNG
uniref:Uncharacterized protein n=1 Tax=Octopus bimaculoides TaxID=37653 RepID=A0A0L8FRM4_OCTBM